jgi:hypothetical protein
MDVLATRVLQYRHDDGKETDVTLTVFVPILNERGDWKCQYKFSPPKTSRAYHVYGIDSLQAILDCLGAARAYIEHPTEERTSWQGMSHSGLPWRSARPEGYQKPQIPALEKNPGDLDVLGTRKVACPDQNGATSALVLTVYKPTQMGDETWKCAYSFEPLDGGSIRYGTGADYIESFLDALTLARVTYDSMLPEGWRASETEDLLDCAYFPYKVGRAFFKDPIEYNDPDMRDGK